MYAITEVDNCNNAVPMCLLSCSTQRAVSFTISWCLLLFLRLSHFCCAHQIPVWEATMATRDVRVYNYMYTCCLSGRSASLSFPLFFQSESRSLLATPLASFSTTFWNILLLVHTHTHTWIYIQTCNIPTHIVSKGGKRREGCHWTSRARKKIENVASDFTLLRY